VELEGWEIKEIGDSMKVLRFYFPCCDSVLSFIDIEVSLEDLLTPAPPSYVKTHHRPPLHFCTQAEMPTAITTASTCTLLRASAPFPVICPCLRAQFPRTKTDRQYSNPVSGTILYAASFKSLSPSNGVRSSSAPWVVSPRRKVDERAAQISEKVEDEDIDMESLRRDSKLTPAISSIGLPKHFMSMSPIAQPSQRTTMV
jgi:hypothetical protein